MLASTTTLFPKLVRSPQKEGLTFPLFFLPGLSPLNDASRRHVPPTPSPPELPWGHDGQGSGMVHGDTEVSLLHRPRAVVNNASA